MYFTPNKQVRHTGKNCIVVDSFVNLPLNPGPENVGVCTVFQRWHEVNLNVEFFAHGYLQYILKDRHKSSDSYFTLHGTL